MSEGGPKIAAKPPEETIQEQEVTAYQLGDILRIDGGIYDGSYGKLYYFDDELLKILPNGVTNQLIIIPLDDEEYEGLGIEEIVRIEKAVEPGFIPLIGLVKGEGVETFLKGGEAGPSYRVVDLNLKEDKVNLESEIGDDLEISFNSETYQGIPRDLPFEVMRMKEIPAESVKKGEDVLEELAAAELNEDEGAVEGAEGEGEEEVAPVILEVIEEFEEEGEKVLKEIPAAQRTFPDAAQVTEMLTHMLQKLSAEQQKNPQRIRSLSRKVEMFINLRNQVVRYGIAGEPRGLYMTSLQTLADLLAQPNVPLSRKVVDMIKALYLDHTPEEFQSRVKGGGAVDPVGEIEDHMSFEFLEDTINKANAMEAEMRAPRGAAAGGGEEFTAGLPRFFLDMEKYRAQIQTPYYLTVTAETEGAVPISQDEEVFRLEPPSQEEALVPALNPGVSSVYKPPIFKINHSLVRLLRNKRGRFLSKDTGAAIRTVEAAEYVAPSTSLLFPRSFLRDLGPIRSGRLVQDIALGHANPMLLRDILKKLGETTEMLTADSILSVGLKGGILGGVSIKDWLESQNFSIEGHGDALHALRPYGLHTFEFNQEQAEILGQKILGTVATLKNYLTERRLETKKFLEDLRFTPAGLLQPPEQQRLLERIQSEPLLRALYDQAIQEFGVEIAGIDLYWMTYIYTKQPDLLIAVLGQQSAIVAKERLRAVRDQYLRALAAAHAKKLKEETSGELPVLNKCKHVEDLEKVRKIKDDAVRLQLLTTKILAEYRSHQEKGWVWCNNCPQHLICEHELFMIRQYLQPRNKDVLEKEMILAFSGGVFHGKYICKNCGQPMRELEFDSHIEFDDSGRPMMGRDVMVDEDAIQKAELDILLTAPGAAEDIEERRVNWGSEDANLAYQILLQLTDRMGIAPDEKDFEKIIQATTTYVSSLFTRKQYARITKGQTKGVIDYDIYRMRFLITGTAVNLLLNIQTRTPDYIVRYTSDLCREGFFGYPLDAESNKTGIECLASTLASFMRDEAPWNLTGFQKELNFQKRRGLWMKLIESRVAESVKDPMVQVAIKEKRSYLASLYGGSGAAGELADQIPKSFRPIPLLLSAEDAAETAVTAEAATEDYTGLAWIRNAHRLARESAILNPDIPYAETTCCFHDITNPSEFWDSQKTIVLPPKTIEISSKRTTFALPYVPPKYQELKGEIDESSLYKLFTSVCASGLRRGLPHELGLTLRCRWCNIEFPEHPSLPAPGHPFNTDKKTQMRLTEEYLDDIRAKQEALRVALTSQGTVIDKDNFQETLDESHLKHQVAPPERVFIPRAENTMTRIVGVKEEPFEGWREVFETCIREVNALPEGATEIQIAKACESLVERVSGFEATVSRRLGKDYFSMLSKLVRLSPSDLAETLTTYFIVPMQRWVSGINGNAFPILKSYDLEDKLVEDIKKGLEPHFRPLVKGVELVGLMRAKVKKFIGQYACAKSEVLDTLRIILTPGGRLMVSYIHRAFLFGPLASILDPQEIPEGADDLTTTAGARIQDIYKAVAELIDRVRDEGLNYSDDQIKILLEDRREKEKMIFIKRQEKMTKEEQQVERMNKRLGLADYAVTLKQVRYLDEEQQEREREQRALAGIVDYRDPTEGRNYDMMGFQVGPAGEAGDGEGYNVEQFAGDDDYEMAPEGKC